MTDPVAIVMVTANGIGELINVFPTGNAQMINVFVKQTRIASLMRNAMLENVFQRTQLQNVKVKLFAKILTPKNKIALGIIFLR